MTTADATLNPQNATSLSDAFSHAGNAATEYLRARVSRTAEQLTSKVIDVAADQLPGDGTGLAAGLSALGAKLEGKNPVRAAIESLWSNGSPAVRAAMVTAVVGMVLLLVLSPVLLLVFLISYLIFAAVRKATSDKDDQD